MAKSFPKTIYVHPDQDVDETYYIVDLSLDDKEAGPVGVYILKDSGTIEVVKTFRKER